MGYEMLERLSTTELFAQQGNGERREKGEYESRCSLDGPKEKERRKTL